MYAFLLVIHIIVSIFLVFVILLQKGRGEGMADVFGGGSSQTTIFGTRAGTFLTTATTASAVIFMVTCVFLSLLSGKGSLSIVDKQFIKKEINKQIEQKATPQETQQREQTQPQLPAKE